SGVGLAKLSVPRQSEAIFTPLRPNRLYSILFSFYVLLEAVTFHCILFVPSFVDLCKFIMQACGINLEIGALLTLISWVIHGVIQIGYENRMAQVSHKFKEYSHKRHPPE
ncbi:MAG: hypothetical protein KDD48_09220, partial [Bdellovibrionales bacterium]|nr:hypothetical protein [Bdellovibrionales bacterium]